MLDAVINTENYNLYAAELPEDIDMLAEILQHAKGYIVHFKQIGEIYSSFQDEILVLADMVVFYRSWKDLARHIGWDRLFDIVHDLSIEAMDEDNMYGPYLDCLLVSLRVAQGKEF